MYNYMHIRIDVCTRIYIQVYTQPHTYTYVNQYMICESQAYDFFAWYARVHRANEMYEHIYLHIYLHPYT